MQPEIDKIQTGKNVLITADQWDVLAFRLIQQTLAPKGYKELKSGSYRGLVVANSSQPGLVKGKVIDCQKISAQLVRTFRQKAKNQVSKIISELDTWAKEDQAKLKACRFWQFSKKTELKYKIRSLLGQAGSAQRILNELDNIGIK